jgi:uncharacterized surface protein with fasciclin (FAS1) repeats
MTPIRPRRALIATGLGAALLLAACGDDSSSGSSATTAAKATTATTATASSGAATSTTMTSTTMASSAPAASGSMSQPFGPACSSVPASGAGSFAGMAKDPAATAASNNPVLSTLVSAVKAAGLVDTLNGPGPFTIFAPANDAFAKIDKGTLDKLLADPTGDLTKILTYHVVAGQALDAQGLAKAGTVKTVNGGQVTITGSGDNLMINGAKVLCGNISTANAKVFIIDQVLMPPAAGAAASGSGAADMAKPFGPACSSVPADGAGSFAGMAKDPAATAASNNPVLSTLVTAVKAAGLVDTLNGSGPFTIFAPANDAFAKIDKSTLDKVLGDPKGALTKILTYHVVAGKALDPQALASAKTLTTVEGAPVTISGSGQDLMVNGAKVICGNVTTANAKVYIIDSVLMPTS